MTTAKGGQPLTGSVKWLPNKKKPGTFCWHARFTLPNKKRSKFVALDPNILHEDEQGARAAAREAAERVRATGGVSESVKETVAEYSKRWCKWREANGFGCVDDDRVLLEHHALPIIGNLDVRTAGRDDLKRLVAELDAKARRGYRLEPGGRKRSFGWKTAQNAWIVVRALFRDALSAKQVDLCVRSDNPADGVVGPDTGTKKAKVYLWPSEFLSLVSSPRVPRRWRRLFSLAVLTYARAGELAALTWEDVDLEHGTIHIHSSVDARRGSARTKSTKSDTARRIPIEPALAPLLSALHAEAKGRGKVLHVPSLTVLSRNLKRYLVRAGVDRADLHKSDATRKAMTFHDLRATGITWCAVRGDDPLKIKQRAGHASFSTTELYQREAENLSQGFGAPFPPLPPDLLSSSVTVRDYDRTDRTIARKNKAFMVAPPGFEPAAENSPEAGEQAESSLPSPAADDETGRGSEGLAGGSADLAIRNPEPLTVGVLRKKLDAAIVAEAWDAVKAIRERIIEAEREAERAERDAAIADGKLARLDDARRRGGRT